jgi:uncharacterized protein (TIGR03083 family)
VPGSGQPLVPQPGERGLASADPAQVAALLDGAWQGLLEVAADVDLEAPSRLPGWTARDVLVHLGTWDGRSAVTRRVDDARAGVVTSHDDTDAHNAGLRAEHHDASRPEVLRALETARQRAADVLASPDVEEVGRRWVGSVVGELPITGLLVAQAYELAVHAMDLRAAGAPEPPRALLDAGIGAVVDVTGALAARRGLTTCFAVTTPVGSWAMGSVEDAWTTVRLELDVPGRQLSWPGVEGSAEDVLDAAAGRTLAAQLVVTRRLRLHGVPGLLRLLPALDPVTTLPGGSALQVMLRSLSQTGRLAGRVGGGVGAVLARRPR